ncbi:myrosinase 1-like [Schistocerca americana]|uniref:myrosinase 1-like n=1 Tax=Schistocerca americana TaxID=7009 RepID=UPI001F503D06|nr:myrosinase 1-like [Schistocerca americana]
MLSKGVVSLLTACLALVAGSALGAATAGTHRRHLRLPRAGAVNQFPDGFMLGAATASYQIEGGWDADGKGENIWDRMFHEHPEYGTNGDNGDVACDSYHKYAEDVQALKNLNANVYRFSISWARILPNGDTDVINQAGLDYYNSLIDLLLENGIQPLVTMYHWDLPQALQYIGGWPNPILADYFVEYARVLFENFGDRVKFWITFNEPAAVVSGYASVGRAAPSLPAPGIGDYLAAHTIIKAHARVYHLYQEQYKASQQGYVGITLNSAWNEPATNSTEDIEAAERARQFEVGIYAHPIFSEEGDYPSVMRQRVDANSAAEGRPRSRLPSFTSEEVAYIRGTSDFFGVNHYSSVLSTSGETGTIPSKEHDAGVISYSFDSYPQAASSWLQVIPWGFRKLLNWIAAEYPEYPIIVTENGYSDWGELDDKNRTDYYTSYLAEMLKAINTDGNNVIGYTAWSLLDNLEWTDGFAIKFGLYQVDFNDPERPRTAKDSVQTMAQIYASKELPIEYFE